VFARLFVFDVYQFFFAAINRRCNDLIPIQIIEAGADEFGRHLHPEIGQACRSLDACFCQFLDPFREHAGIPRI
jgi:hypothetical protein